MSAARWQRRGAFDALMKAAQAGKYVALDLLHRAGISREQLEFMCALYPPFDPLEFDEDGETWLGVRADTVCARLKRCAVWQETGRDPVAALSPAARERIVRGIAGDGPAGIAS